MIKPHEHGFVSWSESNRVQWAHFRSLSIIFSVLFVTAVLLLIHKPLVFTMVLLVVYLGGTYLMGARYVRKQGSAHHHVGEPEL